MAALSDYLESGILSHIFFGETFTPPTSLSVALTAAPPKDTDTGATIDELPSGAMRGLNHVSTNYSRIDLGSSSSGSGVWNLVGTDNSTAFQVNSDIPNHSGYFYPLYLHSPTAVAASTAGSPSASTFTFETIFPGVQFFGPDGVVVSGDYGSTDPSYREYEGNGFIKNKNQIVFQSAVTDWGWVSGIAVLDSATYGAGNILMSATLENPRFVYTGDTIKFDSNSLEISLK